MRLYEKGLIYRGERIINWCPTCKTSISEAEVEYEDVYKRQVAGADVMRVRLNLYKITAGLQIGDNGFSRLIALHSFIFSAVFIDMRILSKHINDRQIMTQTNLKICLLYTSSSVFHSPAAQSPFFERSISLYFLKNVSSSYRFSFTINSP